MAPPDRMRRWFWLPPDDPLIPLLEGLDNTRLVALLRAALPPGGQAAVEARLAAGGAGPTPAPPPPDRAGAARALLGAFGGDDA